MYYEILMQWSTNLNLFSIEYNNHIGIGCMLHRAACKWFSMMYKSIFYNVLQELQNWKKIWTTELVSNFK